MSTSSPSPSSFLSLFLLCSCYCYCWRVWHQLVKQSASPSIRGATKVPPVTSWMHFFSPSPPLSLICLHMVTLNFASCILHPRIPFSARRFHPSLYYAMVSKRLNRYFTSSGLAGELKERDEKREREREREKRGERG